MEFAKFATEELHLFGIVVALHKKCLR